jgi:Ca-activated chloride channel family protein
MTIVGRYRGAADDVSITLSGEVRGERQTFVYDDFNFRERAGGEGFIGRLWATRRIGELLNTIRLNGENPELVDSIVSLSIRFGIITPYTSFLIEEDDILSQTGRAAAADEMMARAAEAAAQSSGAGAVNFADAAGSMAAAEAPMAQPTMMAVPMMTATPAGTMPPPGTTPNTTAVPAAPVQNPIQTVGGKTFILQDGVWTDTMFAPDTMTTTQIEFLSDAYFDLLLSSPELADYLALGERVIVIWEDVAYEITVPQA